jgi:hypothetical protein
MALKSHASVDHQHNRKLKEQETNDRGSITHRIWAASDPYENRARPYVSRLSAVLRPPISRQRHPNDIKRT